MTYQFNTSEWHKLSLKMACSSKDTKYLINQGGVEMQQVRLPPRMPAWHCMSASSILAAPLPTQLFANAPRIAIEEGPSVRVPAPTCKNRRMLWAPGFNQDQPQSSWLYEEGTSLSLLSSCSTLPSHSAPHPPFLTPSHVNKSL